MHRIIVATIFVAISAFLSACTLVQSATPHQSKAFFDEKKEIDNVSCVDFHLFPRELRLEIDNIGAKMPKKGRIGKATDQNFFGLESGNVTDLGLSINDNGTLIWDLSYDVYEGPISLNLATYIQTYGRDVDGDNVVDDVWLKEGVPTGDGWEYGWYMNGDSWLKLGQISSPDRSDFIRPRENGDPVIALFGVKLADGSFMVTTTIKSAVMPDRQLEFVSFSPSPFKTDEGALVLLSLFNLFSGKDSLRAADQDNSGG